jgi:hypothetical protein
MRVSSAAHSPFHGKLAHPCNKKLGTSSNKDASFRGTKGVVSLASTCIKHIPSKQNNKCKMSNSKTLLSEEENKNARLQIPATLTSDSAKKNFWSLDWN